MCMFKDILGWPWGGKYRIKSEMSLDNLSLSDIISLTSAFGPIKNERQWYIQKRWLCFWVPVSGQFCSEEEAQKHIDGMGIF